MCKQESDRKTVVFWKDHPSDKGVKLFRKASNANLPISRRKCAYQSGRSTRFLGNLVFLCWWSQKVCTVWQLQIEICFFPRFEKHNPPVLVSFKALTCLFQWHTFFYKQLHYFFQWYTIFLKQLLFCVESRIA